MSHTVKNPDENNKPLQRSEICGTLEYVDGEKVGEANWTTIRDVLSNHLNKSIRIHPDTNQPDLKPNTLNFCTSDSDSSDIEINFGELEYVEQCLLWSHATRANPQTEDEKFLLGQLEWVNPRVNFDNSAIAMLALLQESIPFYLIYF